MNYITPNVSVELSTPNITVEMQQQSLDVNIEDITINQQVTWGSITGTLSNQTDLNAELVAKYVKPSGGIPKTDMASGVQASLDSADSAYQKPTTGIPKTDLNTSVQDSLDKADTALQEHQSLSAYRTSANQDIIDNALDGRLDTIEGEIPSQASSSNQLADKNFVNSSIATETAHYISNNGEPFTSVAQLEAYTGTVTNNDYAFVTGTDEHGNSYYDRYKATVSGSTITWAKEYRLNNSSFTAQQWASISSGITSGDVALIQTALQPSALSPYRTSSAQDTIDATKADKATTYTKTEVDSALGGKIPKVSSPTTGNIPQLDANGALTNGLGTTQAQGVPIATSISSASTNNEIPSAKGVYDFVEKPYELIEEITLTEATHLIRRTKTPSQVNYNFKSLLVEWYCPVASANANIIVYLNSSYSGYQSNGLSASAIKYSYLVADVKYGKLRAFNIVPAGGDGALVQLFTVNGVWKRNMNSITSLTFDSTVVDVNFPIGSTVKIWGVWTD